MHDRHLRRRIEGKPDGRPWRAFEHSGRIDIELV